MRHAGFLGERLGQAILEGCIRHELEHVGREPRAGVGRIGDLLEHKHDIVWGSGVDGTPVARGVRAYPVKLGFYPLLFQIAVQHQLCGIVALLDHELCALAQGHGVADRVLARVLGEHAGAVGPDIRRAHSNLVVQAHLTLGNGPVERKQSVELAKACSHEAPISVEGDRLVRIGIED